VLNSNITARHIREQSKQRADAGKPDKELKEEFGMKGLSLEQQKAATRLVMITYNLINLFH